MRQALAEDRQRRQATTRWNPDGHAVALRAVPHYDALFGVDFDRPSTKAEWYGTTGTAMAATPKEELASQARDANWSHEE